MAKSIWAILQIPASSDERTIKRAYASLLRSNNPEDNPAGFQVLRSAYEKALQYAKYAKDYPEDAFYDPWDEEDEHELARDTAELKQQPNASRAADANEPEIDPLPPSPIESPPPQSGKLPQPVNEISPEKRNHQDKLSSLEDAIARGAQSSEIQAAFRAVIDCPAMVDIGVYTQTEQHILNLISEDREVSEYISDEAFQAFGWDKVENQGRGSIGEQAVWVRNRWQQDTESAAFLARVQKPTHEFYPAWKEASTDPSTRNDLSKILSIRHLPVVQRFFSTMDAKAPMAFDGLNQNAVGWLSDRLHTHLPKFRFIKWAFVGLVILCVVVSLVFDSTVPASISSGVEQLASASQAGENPANQSIDTASANQTRAHCLKKAQSAPIYYGGDESERSALLRSMATDACNNAGVLRPQSLTVQTNLGVIDLKKRYFGPAMVNFQKVLDVSPNDDIALFGMALARARMGDQNAMVEGSRIAKRSTRNGQKYFENLGLSYDITDDTGALVRFDERAVMPSQTNATDVRVITKDEFTKSAQYYGISNLPKTGYVEVDCLANKSRLKCTVVQELPTGEGLAEVAIHAALNQSPPTMAQPNGKTPSYKFAIQLER